MSQRRASLRPGGEQTTNRVEVAHLTAEHTVQDGPPTQGDRRISILDELAEGPGHCKTRTPDTLMRQKHRMTGRQLNGPSPKAADRA